MSVYKKQLLKMLIVVTGTAIAALGMEMTAAAVMNLKIYRILLIMRMAICIKTNERKNIEGVAEHDCFRTKQIKEDFYGNLSQRNCTAC